MGSRWGNHFSISLFGESHGEAVGVVIDSPPPGVALDMDAVAAFMARRAPGNNPLGTARKEGDVPLIQSGVMDGRATGTPLCAIIKNTDSRPQDYDELHGKARPGHADYTGHLRYGGHNDPRGGGHFSGRLTAPLVFAGAVAMQVLAQKGVVVSGHIASIQGVSGDRSIAQIEAARQNSDSVGGIVECRAAGMPAGIGSPMFDGLESAIASLIFGIPAVRGVEFGEGFAAAAMLGSEHNDCMEIQDGKPAHLSNKHGGILGGISSGMPVIVRVAFKPTPSIARKQQTVNSITGQNTLLEISGRHDPCVVPRAVPCVEACVAIALLDALMRERGIFQWI